MLYLDYALYQQKYQDAVRRLDDVLSEREVLFQQTQPSATDYGKSKVSSSSNGSPFDSYLIAKEKTKVDERIAEAEDIVKDRKKLLELKERELRASMDTHDKIYRMRFIDHWNVYRIGGRVGYSTAQIYRIIKIIEDRIKDATK